MKKTTFILITLLVTACSHKPLEPRRGELAYWLPKDARFKQAATCTKKQKNNWTASGIDCGEGQVYWLSNKIKIEDIKSVEMMKYIASNNNAGCELPIK